MLNWMTHYAQSTWAIWLELSPWLVLGLIAAGTVYVFVPAHRLKKWIGGGGFGGVVRTAMLGVPIPLCSCSVIPTALTLRKRGASKGATSAFLISTPETGIDSVAVTWAMMDPAMTILRPVVAFFTAITCGWLQDLTPDDGRGVEPQVDEDRCHLCLKSALDGHRHGLREKLSQVFSFGFGDMLLDIGSWLLLGVAIAGVLSAAVSPEWMQANLSGAWSPKLLMLAIGIPLYICASASTPVAASLVALGMSPGAALILLLVGPATNIATLTVIARVLGRRAAGIYLASLAGISLLAGFGVDALYSSWLGAPQFRIAGEAAHEHGWVGIEWACALLVLTTLLVLGIKKRLPSRHSGGQDGSGHESCCEHGSCAA